MLQDFKKLETAIIKTMIRTHSSYYGRVLTAGESIDCKTTISQLQMEIDLRKNKRASLLK